MYQDTITVFNFHRASGFWYPSIITGTDLLAAKSSSHATEGISNADDVDIIVHCTAAKVIATSDGGKSYIGPKEYEKCGDPGRHITFTPESDFIYNGAWSDLTPINDDEYDEGLYHALNDEHDGVYMISSAAFYGLLPHFEIGGR